MSAAVDLQELLCCLSARCPAFDALHKCRRCQQTALDVVLKCLPAEGTTLPLIFRGVGISRWQLSISVHYFPDHMVGGDVARKTSSQLWAL
jgi:hypothetical protein